RLPFGKTAQARALERHFGRLGSYRLDVSRRNCKFVTPADYAALQPITAYIRPRKQEAKRHYGSHQYFTKRAWNVVQDYIKHYTQSGDVVCDPYGGSGVTAIEALVLGRKAVYLDVSAWAAFLAQQIASAPVDLLEFNQCFSELEDACARKL